MKGLLTVFKKEFRENLRDRRTVITSLLVGPIAGPALFVMLMMMLTSKEAEKAEQTLELAIQGAANAPNLVAYLEQQGVEVKAPPEDPEAAIINKDEDVIVRIPEDFTAAWEAGEPAPVELLADESRRHVGTTLNRVRGLLSGYGRQIGTLRLQLRGVPATLATPLQLKTVDLSTPTSRGAQMLVMLPYFLMLTAFIGGMHLAIDTTAGEKERRSLEPLLINPVPRWQVMSGKLLTTTVFAFISLVLTMVAFKYAIPLIPADTLGFVVNIDYKLLLKILFVIAPVAIFAAALLTILASFAKSFREAQSYMGLVVFIPMLPSLWLMVNPVKAQTWMMTIPLLSQNVLITDMIRGEAIPSEWIGISIATSLALGIILALVAATLYNRPKLIFAGS